MLYVIFEDDSKKVEKEYWKIELLAKNALEKYTKNSGKIFPQLKNLLVDGPESSFSKHVYGFRVNCFK